MKLSINAAATYVSDNPLFAKGAHMPNTNAATYPAVCPSECADNSERAENPHRLGSYCQRCPETDLFMFGFVVTTDGKVLDLG